tara:strand:- start:2016 stop:2462 length:447 start_codon:yes stop_codon:yes gene_type:complete
MEEMIVLSPSHKEAIRALEKAKLGPSPTMEQEMSTWDARWRAEALDHYLPQGWSFGIQKDEKLVAYSLIQPLLFFRGLTQTLWVEWFSAQTPESAQKLVEVVYRWARDKHIQAVVVESHKPFAQAFEESPFSTAVQDGLLTLKTSKMK